MRFLLLLALFLFVSGVIFLTSANIQGMEVSKTIQEHRPDNLPIATIAGGCFWCIESEFRALEGVIYTRVGYEGGHTENPSYKDITSGKTGHAEALEVYYDPDMISYKKLIDFFLTRAHDPTQKNKQGVDVGTQYRSVIFYHDHEQKKIAQQVIKDVNLRKVWKSPIVTELAPKTTFWEAETYHQQYYEKYEDKTGTPHIRVLFKKNKKAL